MDLVAVIEEAVVSILREAVIRVPDDVKGALRRAAEEETSDIARTQLETILRNLEAAERLSLPLCQDTGVPVFFVSGRVCAEIEEGVRRGVERATREIPLRPNAVHRSQGTLAMSAAACTDRVGRRAAPHEDPVLPRGRARRASALAMLTPRMASRGEELRTGHSGSRRALPPTIVGVGIGGTADLAVELATALTAL